MAALSAIRTRRSSPRLVEPAPEGRERAKLGRAPLVVVVGARRAEPSAIPWVEQLAACAAATQNALLAATAHGLRLPVAHGEPCYDTAVKAALGMQEHDAVVGFLCIGTPPPGSRPPRQTDTAPLDGLVHEWTA